MHPNPFRRSAFIRFTLPTERDVRCDVFDVTGRLVATLLAERVTAGEHELDWDGRDRAGIPTPGGVYFVRIRAGSETRSAKVIRLPGHGG